MGRAAEFPSIESHLIPKRKRPRSFLNVAFIYAGNYLLSHTLSRAVTSAQRGLTSVFGMGTGGSPAVRSPTNRSRRSLVVSRWPFRANRRTQRDNKLFKEREDDLSQLNRLGVAYFHVCLLPISATTYFGVGFF